MFLRLPEFLSSIIFRKAAREEKRVREEACAVISQRMFDALERSRFIPQGLDAEENYRAAMIDFFKAARDSLVLDPLGSGAYTPERVLARTPGYLLPNDFYVVNSHARNVRVAKGMVFEH